MNFDGIIRKSSTILAIKKFAHRLPTGLIYVSFILAFVGVHAALGCGFSAFRGAARRTTVGKTGLVRLQFKLF